MLFGVGSLPSRYSVHYRPGWGMNTQGSCQQWYKEDFGVDVFSFVSDLHPALDRYQLLLNLCSNMNP